LWRSAGQTTTLPGDRQLQIPLRLQWRFNGAALPDRDRGLADLEKSEFQACGQLFGSRFQQLWLDEQRGDGFGVCHAGRRRRSGKPRCQPAAATPPGGADQTAFTHANGDG